MIEEGNTATMDIVADKWHGGSEEVPIHQSTLSAEQQSRAISGIDHANQQQFFQQTGEGEVDLE